MHPWSLFVYAVTPLAGILVTEWLHQTSLSGTALFYKSDEYSTAEQLREFAPTFIIIFILIFTGFFFLDLDWRVKTMEPFYQISKANGATGSHSLCIDYNTEPLFFTPFKAISNGHWAVFCSSLATIIDSNVLPTLFVGIIVWDEYDNMGMSPIYTYAFEGALACISLLMIALAVILQMRRSGVPYCPYNFDALIRFTGDMNVPNSLSVLLKTLDDEISEQELNDKVGPLRFRLRRRNLGTGDPRFDIVLQNEPPETTTPSCSKTRGWFQRIWDRWTEFFATNSQIQWCRRVRKRWLWKDNHPTNFQTVPLIVITFHIIGLFVLVTGQPFWAHNSTFFTFMGERRFARSVVSTVLHTVIWVPISRSISIMEPIYCMRREAGTPFSTLDTKYGPCMLPFQDLYYSAKTFYKKDSKRLSDAVEMVVTSSVYASSLFIIAWNASNSFGPVFIPCICIMIVCEAIMVLTLGVLFIYCRHPILPRQPNTPISKLLFVYATDIVKEGAGSTFLSKPWDESSGPSNTHQYHETKAARSEPPPDNPEDNSSEIVQLGTARDPPTASSVKPPGGEHSIPPPVRTQDATPVSRSPWQRTFIRGHSDTTEPKQAKVSELKSTRKHLDYIDDGHDGRCAFGRFMGRDGRPHVGIGRFGPGMEPYELTKERQNQIDDGTVMGSRTPVAGP